MDKDTTYNGWTNYQTWRVNIEMFDGADYASSNDLDAYDLGLVLREHAIELIDSQGHGFAFDYAYAFLNEVNWREIAEHQIDDYREKQE
jgi:hypothetical protein